MMKRYKFNERYSNFSELKSSNFGQFCQSDFRTTEITSEYRIVAVAHSRRQNLALPSITGSRDPIRLSSQERPMLNSNGRHAITLCSEWLTVGRVGKKEPLNHCTRKMQ